MVAGTCSLNVDLPLYGFRPSSNNELLKGLRKSASKRHFDRLGRFCPAHGGDLSHRHTDTDTDTVGIVVRFSHTSQTRYH